MKLADSIAYLNHDIDDAVRAGLIEERDLPVAAVATLGHGRDDRLERLVASCVEASWDAAQQAAGRRRIELEPTVLAATDELRDFLFDRVYLAPPTLAAAERGQHIVEGLFLHYEAHPEQIEGFSLPGDPAWRRAADYVSGMTDGFATRRARDLGLPID